MIKLAVCHPFSVSDSLVEVNHGAVGQLYVTRHAIWVVGKEELRMMKCTVFCAERGMNHFGLQEMVTTKGNWKEVKLKQIQFFALC